MKQKKPAVFGYIRVSTIEQDTEKNQAEILHFANKHDFGQVKFVSEKISGMKSWKKRKLYEVVQELQIDDVLIVPELSRLGRSISDILEVLNVLGEKKVKVFSVKENFQLTGKDIQSKVMRTMFALFAEIERDLISTRTKEGLAAARKNGKQLGRPKGPGRSKLDAYRPEIEALLANGATKKFVAQRYNVTPATLINWKRRNHITITQKP